ncbi:polymer-forming cytoskeletal protein [Ethanoligenens harbinense]|uniref:Polymer-forming cytoskeletal protein n=1 Tax=Ethanoligenens harbinense (strain DSM 18485 / JCM 12961 / CGMCC 1.5033 / YUAN-3) TaxID=663278 RepID=E6U300_ETHHY|nr:polymer-forming cytoskeletal protein [Ethanoligenens harbinense]ADU26367.1 hypothetical protein Ethha_0798 [Ethanoligenens harbinense YUAN-3]AVQ95496.1 hypothetical protein CXQ68_04125 [Ethanoligenens harbinense YUAN-3]AYF38160.1 hypothetical protein CXP51_03980 [Ethanoligenens harbinense]AYF40905.1 hypothetical protein CN246_04115 [Ethanoligenens harbinense]QCN91737.1 hypothetical protein DRA42_04120 [Ethanoligenens harbinense]
MNIKRMYRKYREQTGSALIAVLIVFVVFVVLGAAVISLSLASGSQTQAQIYQQQAYFAAKSAVSATMKYISDPNTTNLRDSVNALTTGNTLSATPTFKLPTTTPATALKNVQSCPITITKISATSLKVASTATVHGITATAIAYMKSSSAPLPIYPFDNLIYVNGSATLGQSQLTGNIVANGSFSYGNGSVINGTLLSNGDVTLDGDGSGLTGVKAKGTVTITGSGRITNGDVYATNDLIMSGSGKVNGSVYIGQSGTLSNGNITGNATFGGNASFSGGSNRINGNLTTGGTYTYTWGNISTFVGGMATENATVSPVVIDFDTPTFNSIAAPSGYTSINIGTSTFSSGNTYSINDDCVLSFDSKIKGYSNYVIKFNTIAHDINVVINSAQTVPSNIHLIVTGPNKLFVYLRGNNTSLNITNGNCALIMSNNDSNNNANAQPEIFIIGESGSSGQSVTLSSDTRFDGYIYLPNGTFTAGGANTYTYKLFGSVCAQSIIISNNVKLQYIAPPDLSGTPLNGMASGSGSGGGGTGSWTLDGWADK